MKSFCISEVCERPAIARGMCKQHYARWRKTGDAMLHVPIGTKGRSLLPALDRFNSKYQDTGYCWEWTDSKREKGYGQFWDGESIVYAHRFSYEANVGPIPDGTEVDHRCRNRGCVRPSHLRAVTHQVNVDNRELRRGYGTSGTYGVYWHGNKWVARIWHEGRVIHGGRFNSIEDAEECVRELEQRHRDKLDGLG